MFALQAALETGVGSDDLAGHMRAPLGRLINVGVELLAGTHGLQFTSLVLINKIVDASLACTWPPGEHQRRGVIAHLADKIHAGAVLSLVLNSITLQRRVIGKSAHLSTSSIDLMHPFSAQSALSKAR